MTGKQLTEYFRQVIDLECTIQCQKKIMLNLKNVQPKYPTEPLLQKPHTDYHVRKLYDERNQLKYPEKPVNELVEPQKPIIKLLEPCRFIFFYPILFVGVGVLLVSALVCLFSGSFSTFLWMFFLGIAVALGSHVLGHFVAYKSDIKDYNLALERYYEQCDEQKKQEKEHTKAIAAYEAKRQEYDDKIEIAENKVREANDKIRKDWIAVKNVVDQDFRQYRVEVEHLSKLISEAGRTLKALYDIDVIYPKYRNMVAICTIYEYLDSGRCSSLEGPNGAYNLYEAELRQNLIISKLDDVIDNMNIIQRNQFQLYKKLESIDSSVKNINRKVNEIANNSMVIARDVAQIRSDTATIARNSQITALSSVVAAQCAVITAQNTEAMKYMALIN